MCGLLTVVPGLPQTNINTTRIRFKCMLTHLSAESEKNMQGIMYSAPVRTNRTSMRSGGTTWDYFIGVQVSKLN